MRAKKPLKDFFFAGHLVCININAHAQAMIYWLLIKTTLPIYSKYTPLFR